MLIPYITEIFAIPCDVIKMVCLFLRCNIHSSVEHHPERPKFTYWLILHNKSLKLFSLQFQNNFIQFASTHYFIIQHPEDYTNIFLLMVYNIPTLKKLKKNAEAL